MKSIKLPALQILIAVLFIIQSCSLSKSGHFAASKPIKPAVTAKIKRDTVYFPGKTLTPQEHKAAIEAGLKSNYEKYYLPEFKKISDANLILKNDIHSLIANNGQLIDLVNLVKLQKDTMQGRINYYQSQTLKYQQDALKYQVDVRKAQHENAIQYQVSTDKTLAGIDKITRYMLYAGCIVICIIILLVGAVFYILRQIKAIKKQLNYATL